MDCDFFVRVLNDTNGENDVFIGRYNSEDKLEDVLTLNKTQIADLIKLASKEGEYAPLPKEGESIYTGFNGDILEIKRLYPEVDIRQSDAYVIRDKYDRVNYQLGSHPVFQVKSIRGAKAAEDYSKLYEFVSDSDFIKDLKSTENKTSYYSELQKAANHFNLTSVKDYIIGVYFKALPLAYSEGDNFFDVSQIYYHILGVVGLEDSSSYIFTPKERIVYEHATIDGSTGIIELSLIDKVFPQTHSKTSESYIDILKSFGPLFKNSVYNVIGEDKVQITLPIRQSNTFLNTDSVPVKQFREQYGTYGTNVVSEYVYKGKSVYGTQVFSDFTEGLDQLYSTYDEAISHAAMDDRSLDDVSLSTVKDILNHNEVTVSKYTIVPKQVRVKNSGNTINEGDPLFKLLSVPLRELNEILGTNSRNHCYLYEILAIANTCMKRGMDIESAVSKAKEEYETLTEKSYAIIAHETVGDYYRYNSYEVEETADTTPKAKFNVLQNIGDIITEKYGVVVKVLSAQEIAETYKLPESTSAFTDGSTIIVNGTNADITDPAHEMIHIAVAHLRATDTEAYEKLLQSWQSNNAIIDIANGLHKTYNLAFNDMLEEAAIRYLSRAAIQSSSTLDLLDDIDTLLTRISSKFCKDEFIKHNDVISLEISRTATIEDLIKSGEVKEICI